MKVHSMKSLGLFAALLLGAIGCYDGNSPTSMNDAPDLATPTTGGLLAANPLFRTVGPRFDMSGPVRDDDNLLMAAAEAVGSGVFAARRAHTLPADEVVTRQIHNSSGGSIRLGRAGMRVIIPAGALPQDHMSITVQAYAGKYHVYEFLPHGIKFNKPVHVKFDLMNVEKFGAELEHRLAELGKYAETLAECEKAQAGGADLSEICEKIIFLFAAYNEDKKWYEAAVNSAGFVGVHFSGNVHDGSDLKALEIFGITLVGDELTFQTVHFSGYALGM